MVPTRTDSTTATVTGQDPLPPITAVALYAVVEVPGTEELVLGQLRAYADVRGWAVPEGCEITDSGRLGQDEDLRGGWARVRETVAFRRVTGVVVPAFAHVGYHWLDWDRERSWLLQNGQFVIALDPGTDPAVPHHSEVHDPEGVLDRIPLDRGPQLALAKAVLRWSARVPAPEPADMELMALQLTGHARVVVDELRERVEDVAEETSLRRCLDLVVDGADRRLEVRAPRRPSVAYTQGRARLVVGLYRALDDVAQHVRAASPRPSAHP